MNVVYHEATCPYELDDIVSLKEYPGWEWRIDDIELIQSVRNKSAVFRFRVVGAGTSLMVSADRIARILRYNASWKGICPKCGSTVSFMKSNEVRCTCGVTIVRKFEMKEIKEDDQDE